VNNNKLDLFLLSRQVDELCSQINDCGILDSEMEAKLDEINVQPVNEKKQHKWLITQINRIRIIILVLEYYAFEKSLIA
jgi:hypothetical protein